MRGHQVIVVRVVPGVSADLFRLRPAVTARTVARDIDTIPVGHTRIETGAVQQKIKAQATVASARDALHRQLVRPTELLHEIEASSQGPTPYRRIRL